MVRLGYLPAVRVLLGMIAVSFMALGCDALLETPFPAGLSDLTASQNVGSLLGIKSDTQEFELHSIVDNAGNEYLVVLRWPNSDWTGNAAEKLWIFDRTLTLLREYPRSGEEPVRLVPGNPASDAVFLGRPVVANGAGNIVSGDLRFRLFDLDAPPEQLEYSVVAGASDGAFRPAYGVSASPLVNLSIFAGIEEEDLLLAVYPGLELGSELPDPGDARVEIVLAPPEYLAGGSFFRVMGANFFSEGVRFLVDEQSSSSGGRMHVFALIFAEDDPPPGPLLDAQGQVRDAFYGFTAQHGTARATHLTARGVVVDRGDGNLRRYSLSGNADKEFDTGDRQRSVFGFAPDGKAYYRLNIAQGRLMRFRTWW